MIQSCVSPFGKFIGIFNQEKYIPNETETLVNSPWPHKNDIFSIIFCWFWVKSWWQWGIGGKTLMCGVVSTSEIEQISILG